MPNRIKLEIHTYINHDQTVKDKDKKKKNAESSEKQFVPHKESSVIMTACQKPWKPEGSGMTYPKC